MIQEIKNKIYSLERMLYKLLGQSRKRKGSCPYISGDTFRELTLNRYEKGKAQIDLKVLRSNPIVFVESDLLDDYFKNVHPKIKHRYVLISHNSDENITEKYLKYIDKNIHHWFAQNCNIIHDKVTPIPIGLENLHHYNHGRIKNFNRLEKLKIIKKNKLLYGFSVSTNPAERTEALKYLEKLDYSRKIKGNLNAGDYLKYMQEFIAIASPPGNGFDCHRTWEALYLGVVPVVKESVFHEFFKSCNLPIFTLKNWPDLEELTIKTFIDINKENSNMEALYFDFWKEMICSKLKEIS